MGLEEADGRVVIRVRKDRRTLTHQRRLPDWGDGDPFRMSVWSSNSKYSGYTRMRYATTGLLTKEAGEYRSTIQR